MKKFLASLVLLSGGVFAANTSFWVEPCSVVTAGCQAGDMDLARWALQAWAKASGGKVQFVETTDRANALIRVRWAEKNSGLYGETVPIIVNGRRGAELHILVPDPATANDDALMRETIVYLTCLHESGHALGLAHTRAFADIMYSFQFGGDIAEYFGRYRRRLMKREDIRINPGMSPADRAALSEAIKEGLPPSN